MKMRYLNNHNRDRARAQAAVEYAMVIAVVVGALLAMQIYLKRSIQGNLRESADEIGGQFSPSTTLSEICQRFESNSVITADPVLMNLTDPVTGANIETELSFMNRQTNQLSTYDAVAGGSSYEQTGNFSAENLYE